MQRTKNIENYEKTIVEAEQRYGELVISSAFLVKSLKESTEYLDESLGNKKVGPDVEDVNIEEKDIFNRSSEKGIICKIINKMFCFFFRVQSQSTSSSSA